MHCRALLEFLGLCRANSGRLGLLKKRRGGDIGIEHFRNPNGFLPKVASSDGVHNVKAHRLFTMDEVVAIRKKRIQLQASYRPPGQ